MVKAGFLGDNIRLEKFVKTNTRSQEEGRVETLFLALGSFANGKKKEEPLAMAEHGGAGRLGQPPFPLLEWPPWRKDEPGTATP